MNIKTRRLGLVLAAVSATAALSGVGAGSASALTACTGGPIAGQGSSLQNAAQTIWTSTFRTNMNGGCTGDTTVSYTSSSSGTCLSGFGASGTLNNAFAFCGTDDAPTEAQITSINTATGATALSIPVAQAAIAVVVNPPTNCAVEGNTLTGGQVEQVFRGTITSWSTIGTGTGCASTINRVVRNDNSGTTYQFKHYLFTQNSAVVHNSQTWAGLQSSPSTWPGTVTPSQSGCATAMTLPCSGGASSGSGGGDEVRTVGATSGSIGYAALADARSVRTALVATDPNLSWVKVVNASSQAVDPSSTGVSTTKGTSNCNTATSTYGTLPTATGSWNGVYYTTAGFSGATGYPICTLTWDLAVNNYTVAKWGANAALTARTVKDYLGYIVTTLGGQADALSSANDYKALPTDVQTQATNGVAEITG